MSLLLIPGPVTVPEPVMAAMSKPMINHRGPEFAALLEHLEARLRPVFGTSGDVVVLGGSGTSGLEAAIASVFSAGDRVLACPVGAFGKRLITIARTYGIEVNVVETLPGYALDPAALRERLGTTPAYDGVLLTHNETSTGVQNDMAACASVLEGKNLTVVVDAVSGLAASDFRMDAWGFDVVVAASQKALAAPPGLAMAAVSERGWERAARSRSPKFYLDLVRARDFARSGETPWTPPLSIMYALDVALDLYDRTGPERVWLRHARYAKALRAAATALNLDSLSQPDAHSPTVVALKVPHGVDGPAVARTLREQHHVVIGGGQAELKGKIWRIGTMGAVSEGDLLEALAALESALSRHGHEVASGCGVAAASEVFESKTPATAQSASGR